MSEQIVLPGFSGDVVLVNGLCYEFSGYTLQPPEDLEVTALFDTCEACAAGPPPGVGESSASSAESSASDIPVPVIDCNDCDPQLDQYYIVTLGGLTAGTIWAPWNNIATLVKWDINCTWRETEGSALGVVLSYGTVGWTVKLSPVVSTEEIMWQKVESGPFEDECDPLQDMGTHSTCNSASDQPANCTGLGGTSCVVTAAP